jgi:hypothetical protein
MYFEFDKKNDMAFYLSLSNQAMVNVLQELDAVVKDEFVFLPFTISPQKVESPSKKSMINQQVSLANQVFKNSKCDNAQHVLEIVELDDFDTEETKVAEKQPLKRLKKTLLSPKAYEEENKQTNPIETHEKDIQTNPKKTTSNLLDQRIRRKIQLPIVLFKNAMYLQKKEKTP